MEQNNRDADDLVARYSFQPDDIGEGMIKVDEPATLPTLRRDATTSTLGQLDELPLELLHYLLSALDLRSISRLSQVSLRGLDVVRSLHLYRDLLSYAPHAIAALGRTGAVQYHSLVTLHTVLYSRRCVSCKFFGPFLSLLTCERCCYECLLRNQGLWAVPPELAMKCFKLDAEHIKELPVICAPPGTYRMRTTFPRALLQRPMNLVSVKVAKGLGLKVHGSTAAMPVWESIYSAKDYLKKSLRDRNYLSWIQEAPMESLDGDPVMVPLRPFSPNDQYFGMASFPFPSMAFGPLPERGLWCRGCKWASEELRYADDQVAEAALGSSALRDCDSEIVFKNRAWSKTDFAQHARSCYGVKNMPADVLEA